MKTKEKTVIHKQGEKKNARKKKLGDPSMLDFQPSES